MAVVISLLWHFMIQLNCAHLNAGAAVSCIMQTLRGHKFLTNWPRLASTLHQRARHLMPTQKWPWWWRTPKREVQEQEQDHGNDNLNDNDTTSSAWASGI